MVDVNGKATPTFSTEEIRAVLERYPSLTQISPEEISGELAMHAIYEGVVASDTFSVRITAKNPNSVRIPALYEIGGRTKLIAQKHGLRDLRDLHCNVANGSACVCPKQVEKIKMPTGSDLLVFVEELAVPYLYGLHFFDNNGRWPWKEYSHGAIGLYEYCAEDPSPLSKDDIDEIFSSIRADIIWKEYHKQIRHPNPRAQCLCRSGKEFSKCHPTAWVGMLKLREEMKRLGISIRNPFPAPLQ